MESVMNIQHSPNARGFHVLTVDYGDDGGGVVDCLPPGCPSKWKFHEGQRLSAAFPREASVEFSRNFPQARALRDFVGNTIGLLIVSARIRESVERICPQSVEYLPVSVLDHDGAVIGRDYSIMNPIEVVPAIDMKRTQYRPDSFEPDRIGNVRELRLAFDTIPIGCCVFRPSTKPDLVLIDDVVLAALTALGATGFRAFSAEGWNGMYV